MSVMTQTTLTKMWMKGPLTRELGYYRNECYPAELSIFPRNRHIGSVGKVYFARTSQDLNGKAKVKGQGRIVILTLRLYIPAHEGNNISFLIPIFPTGLNPQGTIVRLTSSNSFSRNIHNVVLRINPTGMPRSLDYSSA